MNHSAIRVICCLILSLVSVLGPISRANADTVTEYRVPMFVKESGSPLVKIHLNNSEPYYFLVDTGFSGRILLTKWVTEELKLSAKRQATTGTIKNKPIYSVMLSKVAFVPEEKSKPYILTNTEAWSIDLDFDKVTGVKPRFAGIIGAALLSRVTAVFDFHAGTLILRPEPHPASSIPGATVVPLTTMQFGRSHPDAVIKGVTVNLPGVENVEMLLDTGSDSTHLRPDLALKVTGLEISRERITSFDAVGSETANIPVLLPYLRIGDHVEKDVIVTVAKNREDNLLGMSFLRRFIVTLDIRNERMLLQKAPDYDYHTTQTGLASV